MTLEDFKKISFSKAFFDDGIVFIWVEKEIISKVIEIFEKMEMQYVENVCWVMSITGEEQ